MLVLVSAGVAYRILNDQVQVWMQLRPEEKAWEFPGGKIEAGETPAQALIREWEEEVQISPAPSQCHLFGIYPFQYPTKSVSLHVFLISELNPTFGGEWKNLFEMQEPMLQANIKILEDLKIYFRNKDQAWI